jgi:AraC family transcriptional regulator
MMRDQDHCGARTLLQNAPAGNVDATVDRTGDRSKSEPLTEPAPQIEPSSRNETESSDTNAVHTRSVIVLLEAAAQIISVNKLGAQRLVAQAIGLLRSEPSNGIKLVGENVTRGGLAPWQLRRVTQMIDSRIAETIRVGDLAASVCLCPSYFCRAFRQSAGETPHAYVVRRRIAFAMNSMLSTPKTLSEIAIDCGFADQPHLTRMFRRIVGMSPAAWRRMNEDRGEIAA